VVAVGITVSAVNFEYAAEEELSTTVAVVLAAVHP
jgi:hypothetical protein